MVAATPIDVDEVAAAGHVDVGDIAADEADCEHSCTCMRMSVVVDVAVDDMMRDLCGCSMLLLIIFMVALVVVLLLLGDDFVTTLWRLIELSGDINMIAMRFVWMFR